MLPMIEHKDIEDDEKIFGESYDSEDEPYEDGLTNNDEMIQVIQNSSQNGDESQGDNNDKDGGASSFAHKKLGAYENSEDQMSGDLFATRQIKFDQREDFKKTYEQYIDHQPAQQLPPSHVYELIMNRFYNGDNKIAWPSSNSKRLAYVLLIPLTHLQYVSIPNPMRGKDSVRGGAENPRENLYPVTLFMSMIWIFVYSGIIVWFTFDLTMAFNWHFNVLPMVLYPFGIALRDYKKKVNLEQAIDTFDAQLKEQRMSLAETFSAQIFQITGLMGFTWTLFISLKGVESVSFYNESIQFQMPMLVVVVVVKYLLLVCSKYKTSKALFYVNLACYIIFVFLIALIDYRIEIFGE